MGTTFKNNIFNKNCLKIFDELPNECIDLILSDPPYGQNLRYGLKKLKIKNDKNLNWLFNFAYNAFRVLRNNSYCILFWQWRTFSKLENVMKLAGFNIKTVGIWNKLSPGLGKGLTEQYELIVFFRKNKSKCNFYRGNVFSFPKICKGSEHPHQKPTDLLKILIELSSKKKDLVYDPYLGTGSTAIACIETDRYYLGSEIDKTNFKIALKRIKNN